MFGIIMLSVKSFGQSAIMRLLDSDPRISTTLRSNNVYDPNKNNNTIQGSPYSSVAYTIGNVTSINANISFRYNAYKDVIEFKDGDNIYELPKDIAYSPILLQNKNNIVLEKNNDNSLGYYVELFAENNISLLKKERINLLEGRATDGYRDATPAKFSSLKTEYYIKDNNAINIFPKNKKELLMIYKNSAIESFVSKNSSFIKDENALIQLAKLISTINH